MAGDSIGGSQWQHPVDHGQRGPSLQPHHNERPPRPQPPAQEAGSAALGGVLIMAIPWLIFCTISIAFLVAYHHHSLVTWAVVLAWGTQSLIFVTLRKRMSGSWFLFIGILCLFACLCGSAAGLYNYDSYMYQYWSYEESRSYTNVLPSEPAAAHADAGKIVFSNSARVDTTRAVGFKIGTVYCVAPIVDDTQTDHVEYWAVGTDCCPSRGDFDCDDAWNPTAKSGVVILDATAFFSKRDYYRRAAKTAQFAYELTAAEEPLFVRWVADPEKVQGDFWRKGIGFVIASMAVYLLLSIISGILFHRLSSRQAHAYKSLTQEN